MISCAGMRRALHIFLRNFYPLLNISHHDGSRYIEESSNPVLNFNLLPRRYLKRRVEKEFVVVRKFTLQLFLLNGIDESVGGKSNVETRSIRAPRLLPTNCHTSSLKSRCTKGVSPSVSPMHTRVYVRRIT